MLLTPSSLSQTVKPSHTPSPSSVTYFVDGPWGHRGSQVSRKGVVDGSRNITIAYFAQKVYWSVFKKRQWRNHTRTIMGSARDEFISARVEPGLKMSRVSCA